ncbi:MAG: type I methionyl aminopeptidase [Gemmatimonadota bacterium]
MIRLKTAQEIDTIARAGEIVAGTLALVTERAQPGTSTAELDKLAEEFIRGHAGAEPAFKGLYGFPATLCTSVNYEVVHGIPSTQRVLRSGDLFSVDVGVKLDGLFADAALTAPIGEVSEEARRLLSVTSEALDLGVSVAQPGGRLGDIGAAVQTHVEAAGFSVIRELVGHGVGYEPHEDPHVPNFGDIGTGARMDVGLVIAIEPMVNIGKRHIREMTDGWTVVTADRSLSAHFEHTVGVMEDGPRVLTRLPVKSAAGRKL